MGTGLCRVRVERTEETSEAELLAKVAQRAVAGAPRDALEWVCAAACQVGRATGAGVFLWSGHQLRCAAGARLGALRRRTVLFDLRPRGALRKALRQADGGVDAHEHRLYPLKVGGRLAGALYIEFPDRTSTIDRTLRALAALASSILEREERDQAASAERWAQRRELLEHRAHHETLEQATGRLAHDLKTPLVSLKGYVDMMERGMGGSVSEAQARYLSRMAQAVERQRELIDRLLSRRRSAPQSTELSATAHDVAAALRRSSSRMGIWIDVDAPSAVTLPAPRGELTLLLRELLLGAMEVAPVRSRLNLKVDGPVLRLSLEELPSANARLKRAAALARRLGGHLRLETEEGGAAIVVDLTPADADAKWGQAAFP